MRLLPFHRSSPSRKAAVCAGVAGILAATTWLSALPAKTSLAGDAIADTYAQATHSRTMLAPFTARPTIPLPQYADPVAGIPNPCPVTKPFPAKAPMAAVAEQFGTQFNLRVSGSQWTETYRPVARVVWETLDAVSCTDFLTVTASKNRERLAFNASPKRTFAVGDFGNTRANTVTMDFSKMKSILDSGDVARLSRLVIHEFGHGYNIDRDGSPEYWRQFRRLFAQQGRFSSYAGNDVYETFADVVGYYVGRCALGNPFDSGRHGPYYRWVRDTIFNGYEFGPADGTKPNCAGPSSEELARRLAETQQIEQRNAAIEASNLAEARRRVNQLKAAQPRVATPDDPQR